MPANRVAYTPKTHPNYNPRPRNVGIYLDGELVTVIHAESHREALKMFGRTRFNRTPLIVGNVAWIDDKDYVAMDVL